MSTMHPSMRAVRERKDAQSASRARLLARKGEERGNSLGYAAFPRVKLCVGLAAPNIGRPHTGAETRLPNATDIETNGYSSIFMRLGAERGRGTLWPFWGSRQPVDAMTSRAHCSQGHSWSRARGSWRKPTGWAPPGTAGRRSAASDP